MNKAKSIEAVENILHLQDVSREDNGYCLRAVAKSPFFTNCVYIENYTSEILKVGLVNGYSIMLDAKDSSDLLLKQIVTFISKNTEMFYFEPKILSWGFNCNLSYVEALHEALAE